MSLESARATPPDPRGEHELNNVLSAILGAAELGLREGAEVEEPRRQLERIREYALSVARRRARAASAALGAARATSAQLVLVEDDAVLRSTTREMLEAAGLSVHDCADSTSAAALVQQHAPDLVLLDVWLEGEDASTLLSTLRRAERAPRLLLLSGDGNLREVAQRHGARHLAKPFTQAELLRAVREALE